MTIIRELFTAGRRRLTAFRVRGASPSRTAEDALPHWNIPVQLALGVLVILVLEVVVGAVALRNQFSLRAWAQEANERTAQTFEDEIQESNRATRNVASWLTRDPSFQEAIRAHDLTRLGRDLEFMLAVRQVGAVTLVDSNGRTLVGLPPASPATPAVPLASDPVSIRQAEPNQAWHTVVMDDAGGLHMLSYFPVYDPGAHAALAMLVADQPLDNAFLKSIPTNGSGALLLVYQGHFTATNLNDQGDAPLAQMTVPDEVRLANQTDNRAGGVSLKIGAGNYLFLFSPLAVDGQRTGILYGTGIPVSLYNSNVAEYDTLLGVLLLTNLILLSVGAFLLVRRYVNPLDQLRAAAAQMALGNFANPIHTKRDDELGALASSLEQLRQLQRQALESRQLEANRYRAVVESLPAPLILADANDRIEIVNPAAQALLRQSEAELCGTPWHKLFGSDEIAQSSQLTFQAVGDAGGDPTRTVRARVALRLHPATVLDVIATRIQSNHQAYGSVLVLQDSTLQEAMSRSTDDFLFNLAHELETPLASLRQFTHLILEEHLSSNPRELGTLLGLLQKTTIRFSSLVESLIDIGRLRAGKLRVRTYPVPLNSILQDAILQVEPLLQARAQALDLQLSAPPDTTVLADRQQIIRVIINLLKNANKYSPAGKSIGLATRRQDGFVFVEISDQGAGISPEEKALLFQRFYRTKRAEEEGAGIGIGLALAKGIVEAHSGEIGVTSELERGTTFWFSLPVTPEAAPASDVRNAA